MSKTSSGWGAAPTRKWVTARIVAVGSLATLWVTSGGWDQPESVLAIALVTEAAASYLMPNASADAPVPAGAAQPA